MSDLISILHRQAAFSRATFGPGARTEGILDHMTKEMDEIREAKIKSDEWVDEVILAWDGLLRALQEENPTLHLDKIAELAFIKYTNKLTKNELRSWPDWRTADPNKAIEHDRSKD